MKSESRNQKSEVRNQKSEIRSQNLPSVLCRLSFVFCCLSSIVCFLAMLLAGAGCQRLLIRPATGAETDNEFKKLSVYSLFAPAKINIMPLTEFISADNARQANINLYVSLLDSFGAQIKSPCVFRFELYQRVQRSSDPKGGRVIIWPDIDLTDPAANNEYWRDFLRTYEFNLPFEPSTSQNYILQVSCLCPNAKRLSTEFALRFTK
jgi:hypothetical protein